MPGQEGSGQGGQAPGSCGSPPGNAAAPGSTGGTCAGRGRSSGPTAPPAAPGAPHPPCHGTEPSECQRSGGGIPDFAFGYFNVVLTSEHPNGDGEIS